MEEALAADLQVQGDPVIGVTITVPVLAVEELGDLDHILPGVQGDGPIAALFRLELGLPLGVVQDVLAVVEDLGVMVVSASRYDRPTAATRTQGPD